MGLLRSNHSRAQELSDSLWSLKEIFLVGFFLQIGMSGLPTASDWLFAGALLLVLPLKGLLFLLVLSLFKLRARNAFLGASVLTVYSEFGLIVAAGIPMMADWMVPLALTVALSFTLAAPLNHVAHPLFRRLEPWLQRLQRGTDHPDDLPAGLGTARALVFGMGRTGTAAYDRLQPELGAVIGLESDPYRVADHLRQGRTVVTADAEDLDFWRCVKLDAMEVAVLAMDDVEAKLIAARELRQRGFKGPIIAHALHADDVERIRDAGADDTHLTMHEAGLSLARKALNRLASSA